MSHPKSRWVDDELASLAQLSHTFFAEKCRPHEERWAAARQVDRHIWVDAGRLGLLCASIDEEFGGGGGDLRHEVVIWREQQRALAPSFNGMLHSGVIAHYIQAYGTSEQKQRWLPDMASGSSLWSIAMTEPGTGSDLQSITTSARRVGSEYVIKGAKTFITNAMLADLVLVVCRTGGAGAEGVSLIAVETDRPGFSRGRQLEKIGRHGSDTVELFFDDVRVPAENLLGGVEGRGFVQLMQQLPYERLLVANHALGDMSAALDLTIAYTQERSVFGKPLAAQQNTQFVLAECATVLDVAWSYVDNCVESHLAGEFTSTRAAMAKWWVSEQQGIVMDKCLQLFGGYGYMAESPIARLYCDARVQRIYGGANEIMKQIIAKDLL